MIERVLTTRYDLADLLADSFTSNPLSEWVTPGMRTWMDRRDLFRGVIRAAIKAGVLIETTGSAVAFTGPPLIRNTGVTEQTPPRLKQLIRMLDEARPAEPHWYFMGLASVAKGHAAMLNTHRVERADAGGLPCYIEISTGQRWADYFVERYDFEITGRFKTRTSPEIITVWREPR